MNTSVHLARFSRLSKGGLGHLRQDRALGAERVNALGCNTLWPVLLEACEVGTPCPATPHPSVTRPPVCSTNACTRPVNVYSSVKRPPLCAAVSTGPQLGKAERGQCSLRLEAIVKNAHGLRVGAAELIKRTARICRVGVGPSASPDSTNEWATVVLASLCLKYAVGEGLPEQVVANIVGFSTEP